MLLLLLAAAAQAQVAAAPPGHIPEAVGAAVPGAPKQYDYGAKLTLSKEDLADPEKFEAAARDMFEAYLAHERIRGLAASVARGRFAKVLPWNHEFAKAHADSLTLSFAKVEAAGKVRFAQRTSLTYNGKKVDLYRYADGVRSATSVFVDGEEQQERFFTKDEETYKAFRAWFHERLGEPPAK